MRTYAVQCSDEQRFQVTAKLCEEVLGGVADGSLQLAASEGVLADALHILASKEIKLSAVQRYNKVLPMCVCACACACACACVLILLGSRGPPQELLAGEDVTIYLRPHTTIEALQVEYVSSCCVRIGGSGRRRG